MSTLERRIEALEERRQARSFKVGVVEQNEDGTWPADPSDAALIIRNSWRYRIAQWRREEAAIVEALNGQSYVHEDIEELAPQVYQALQVSGFAPLPAENEVKSCMALRLANRTERQLAVPARGGH